MKINSKETNLHQKKKILVTFKILIPVQKFFPTIMFSYSLKKKLSTSYVNLNKFLLFELSGGEMRQTQLGSVYFPYVELLIIRHLLNFVNINIVIIMEVVN